MLVGTKNVFPFFVPQSDMKFKVAEWDYWPAQYIVKDLIYFDPPPRTGCYRLFRLRCTHSDDLPPTSNICIQLTFGEPKKPKDPTWKMPKPFPPFAPGSVLLQPVHGASLQDKGTLKTDVSVWFTIGKGTSEDLKPYLTSCPELYAGLHGVSEDIGGRKGIPEEKCILTLYSVVLECWDFTDPHAQVPTMLPTLNRSYAGTRLITPDYPSLNWYIHGPGHEELFSRQRGGMVFEEANARSTLKTRRYGYGLRANFETIAAPDRALVRLMVPESGDEHTWVFEGFNDQPSCMLHQLASSSPPWFPQSWPGLNGNFSVMIESSNPKCSLGVNWLWLDAYEYPDDLPDALPITPRSLVYERPLVLEWIYSPKGNTEVTIGTFQSLFSQGMPRLAIGTVRKYCLRVGVRGPAGGHYGMDLTLTFKIIDQSKENKPVTFSFQVKQTEEGDQGEYYFRSPPFAFADGREPSISHSDWKVEIGCKSDQLWACNISECVLEAIDEVTNDEHTPSGHSFALALPGRPHPLPKSPSLALGTSPFSISLWYSSAYNVFDNDDPDESVKYVIVSLGKTLSMGATSDGALFATLLAADGQAVTALWPDKDLDMTDTWYQIAMTWDGAKIQLVVDGVMQAETFPLAGPLSPTGGEFVLGSDTFAGSVRSVCVWSEALPYEAVKHLPFSIPKGQKPLLAQIEFAGQVPLVSSPGVAEWANYKLSDSTKLSWEMYALAIAPPASASFTADVQLHITAENSYTLEAWIAPTTKSPEDGVQFIAGKQTQQGVGYSMALVGTRLIGTRGMDSVVSEDDLVVSDDAVWRHVAVVFNSVDVPPSLSLYIDGILSGTSRCEQLPPSQDIDIITTDFTVGGWGDTFIPSDSFWGYIGKVRFWRIARSGADIRDWMYTTIDPESPALAAEYGFTNAFANSGGDNAMPVFNRNAELVMITREIEVGKVRLMSRRLLTSRTSRNAGLSIYPTGVPDAVVLRREAQLVALAEDESTTIWVDFMVDIFCIMLDVLGFDVTTKFSLRNICYGLWLTVEAVRSQVVNSSTVKQSVIEEILNQDEKDWLLLDLSEIDWTSNIQGSDVTTAEDGVKVFVNVIWSVKESGQLWKLVESVGHISWFCLFKFQLKLVPVIGQIYLAVRILLALKDLFFAIKRLLERLKENKKKNSKPGLCVSWEGGSCSAASRIPLRAGGSAQVLKVELRPPSTNGPVTVTATATCAGVEVIGGHMEFQEDDGSPKLVTVKAAKTAPIVSNASLSFRMTSKTIGGSIIASLDIRKQDIIVSPEKTSISMDKQDDKTELTVSLSAIVDIGQTVKVHMKDVTEKKDDPLPSKVLEFKPDTLTFTRVNAISHQNKPQTVEVRLKDKPKTDESPDDSAEVQTELLGKRGAAVLDLDGEQIQRKVPVGVATTHTTIITMVTGQKGDCYILSDQLGLKSQFYHGLIDGGTGGSIDRLLLALLTRGVKKLNFMCATHYDDDHINGLLKLLALPTPLRPAIDNVWFNDPNLHSTITTIIGNNTMIHSDGSSNAELAGTDIGSDDPDQSSDSWDLSSFPDRITSLPQGQLFIQMVNALKIPAASPRGRGPAVPDSTINHDTKGILPYLQVTMFGPTLQNVNIMRQKPKNGPAINRSSAIFTVRYKPNETTHFSALFTGDAHDHLPNAMDIRGPILLQQPRHWLVMKVPHHGSKNSEDASFFHNYTARYYLISSWYSIHKIPALISIEAILKGCYDRHQLPPIIITTSWWTGSKIDKIVPDIMALLLKHPGTMYIFTDNKTLMTLEFKDGVLQPGWQKGTWCVTVSGYYKM